MLVGVVSLLEGEDGGLQDAAVLFQGVGLWREGQDGLVVGRQPGEAQLGQVVDEEVELGGHAAETGLDQPARGDGAEAGSASRGGGGVSVRTSLSPGEEDGGVGVRAVRPQSVEDVFQVLRAAELGEAR